jgi:hypothetical protein
MTAFNGNAANLAHLPTKASKISDGNEDFNMFLMPL